MEFENKIINGVHATRYIMSYIRAGGTMDRIVRKDNGKITIISGERRFKEWLTSLGLNEEDIRHISNIANNGALELEINAKKWIQENY